MTLTNHALGITTDWCSEAGARQLAERIRDYWASQGKAVRIEIEKLSRTVRIEGKIKIHSVYCVRSDMIGGWPQ